MALIKQDRLAGFVCAVGWSPLAGHDGICVPIRHAADQWIGSGIAGILLS